MWRLGQGALELAPTFHSSVTELTASTQRTIVYATLGVYFVWHLVATATWPATIGRLTWPITLIVAATCLLTLVLLPRRLLVAHSLYQIGLVTSITFALYLFGRPEIAWLFTLLPFLSAIVGGWRASSLVEVMVAALVGLFALGILWPGMSPTYAVGVVLVGAFTGVIGVASFHNLLTAIHWSLVSFEQAQKNMQEARHHRGQHRLAHITAAIRRIDSATKDLLYQRVRLKIERIIEVIENLLNQFIKLLPEFMLAIHVAS